jgi:hypothetical protein
MYVYESVVEASADYQPNFVRLLDRMEHCPHGGVLKQWDSKGKPSAIFKFPKAHHD